MFVYPTLREEWFMTCVCRLCPIIKLSNVTGEGLDYVSLLAPVVYCALLIGLHSFVPSLTCCLRAKVIPTSSFPISRSRYNLSLGSIGYRVLTVPQYCVTEVWSVPYVGTVVDGIVNAGRCKSGDTILIGPDSNGNFQSTAIKSIQRKRYGDS